MSHKQAKRLRKEIGYNKSASPAEYVNTTHKVVMVETGRVDEKGNAIMIPQARVQRHCTGLRCYYQSLKGV